MMNFTLELDNISFHYTGIGGSKDKVLDQVNLRFDQKACTAVVGPSGSGKTTLIQLFTGLLKPVSGTVRFNGQDIWQKPTRFGEIRKKIGLVFQFPETQLFEETVYKDISFGPLKSGFSRQETDERVRAAMAAVGLSFEKFAERSPFKLSEGEKRRVAIAGILAMGPGMVVMDEPTAGLDPRGVRTIVSVIDTLSASGVSVLLITHNMELVARVADRVLVMNAGKIIWDGHPRALFDEKEVIQQSHLEIPAIVHVLKDLSGPLPEPVIGNPETAALFNDIERTLNNVIM